MMLENGTEDLDLQTVTDFKAVSNPVNAHEDNLRRRLADQAGKGKMVEVPVNAALPESSARARPRLNVRDEGIPPVFAAAVSGFSVVRPALLEVVEAEIMKLRQTRHDKFALVATSQGRLEQEKERLKFMERKVAEEKRSHDRASEEHERAQQLLIAARADEANLTTPEEKIARAGFTRICDSLVRSVAHNLQSISYRHAGWDFKVNRQTALVAKLEAEVATTRADYRTTCSIIDAQIVKLSASVDLLDQLE